MSLRTRHDPLPSPVGPGSAPRPRIPISRVPQPREDRMVPTWRLAKPARIAAALQVAQAQDSGGWFVAGASTEVGTKESVARTIAGREVVFWRNSSGGLVAGPAACPHLGALLDRCPVMDGTMYCRWHGLALTQQGDTHVAAVPGIRRRGADLGRTADSGRERDGEASPGVQAAAGRRRQCGHCAARSLRASGRDRQPAGPVARLLVPPVRLQPSSSRRRSIK